MSIHSRHQQLPVRASSLVIFLGACLLLSCLRHSSFGQPPGGSSLEKSIVLPDWTSLRSPTGRFVIIGSDNMVNLGVVRWAEKVAGKFEKTVGIKMSFERRVVRIVVRPSPMENSESCSGQVMTTHGFEGRKLVQRLIIFNHDKVDRENAREAFCRLLLNGYVLNRRICKKPRSVPFWFSQGVAQNLYSSLRIRNIRIVLGKWQAGELMPLAEFLRFEPKGGDYPDKSVCGAFMGWILSLPDKTECLEKIFRRLGAGRTISPEWLVTCVGGCDSIAELEEKWDNWILRQKRVVYEPGVVTSSVIDQLKDELLLYPGDFGIPLTGDVYQRLELRELIEQRQASWIPVFSSSKSSSLRFLAIGRGKEFGDVAELYCRFLEALGKRKSRRRLEKLLVEAVEVLEKLEKKYSIPRTE